uniref:Lethal(2) giant larvae 2 n=1 Tax=Aceria tosichella TaxID=561515 RepID=A0A6G1S3K3_9ACAR
MFKKLLNVGKGHSSSEKTQHQQQQQQQQKNLFQLNEIRSYGFTHLHCLGYSPTLSLLAVGSKTGLLRVLGNPPVEFSYQLEPGNSIRQIEFIHCRDQSTTPSNNTKSKQQDGQLQQDQSCKGTAAKLVVLTDNGRLHLFELKNEKQVNFTDNTTQTDTLSNGTDCCRSTQQQQQQQQSAPPIAPKQHHPPPPPPPVSHHHHHHQANQFVSRPLTPTHPSQVPLVPLQPTPVAPPPLAGPALPNRPVPSIPSRAAPGPPTKELPSIPPRIQPGASYK